MTSTKYYIWLSVAATAICIIAVSSFLEKPTETPIEQPGSKGPSVQGGRPKASEEARQSHDSLEAGSAKSVSQHQLSAQEFEHLRVSLPRPIDAPWTEPFFNSGNVEDEKFRAKAAEVIPIWIRKAVLDGDADKAGRFLFSLAKLAQGREDEASVNAVFQIYRLGDFEDLAKNKMRAWIENGTSLMSYVTKDGKSVYMDVRARVIDELTFYGDKSLDSVILKAWNDNRNTEAGVLKYVDYGYYLEKAGQNLPVEYWLQRLETPNGFAVASEVLEKRDPTITVDKLRARFAELTIKNDPNSENINLLTVSMATALLRQTNQAQYRDYLIASVQRQLTTGSIEDHLKVALQGLASTEDATATRMLSRALQHENALIGELVIDALGKSNKANATEMLFEAATQKAKAGKGFPASEMRALLTQNTPDADAKYERLKTGLLAGQLGWESTPRNFDALEFYRKHNRR